MRLGHRALGHDSLSIGRLIAQEDHPVVGARLLEAADADRFVARVLERGLVCGIAHQRGQRAGRSHLTGGKRLVLGLFGQLAGHRVEVEVDRALAGVADRQLGRPQHSRLLQVGVDRQLGVRREASRRAVAVQLGKRARRKVVVRGPGDLNGRVVAVVPSALLVEVALAELRHVGVKRAIGERVFVHVLQLGRGKRERHHARAAERQRVDGLETFATRNRLELLAVLERAELQGLHGRRNGDLGERGVRERELPDGGQARGFGQCDRCERRAPVERRLAEGPQGGRRRERDRLQGNALLERGLVQHLKRFRERKRREPRPDECLLADGGELRQVGEIDRLQRLAPEERFHAY